jgi:hypothetical protein
VRLSVFRFVGLAVLFVFSAASCAPFSFLIASLAVSFVASDSGLVCAYQLSLRRPRGVASGSSIVCAISFLIASLAVSFVASDSGIGYAISFRFVGLAVSFVVSYSDISYAYYLSRCPNHGVARLLG